MKKMELFIKWNEYNYQKFLCYLKKQADNEYKKFHQKLIKNDNVKLIGIRMPILRKIAKEIKEPIEFIKFNKHIYYEETILHGLVLNNINDNFLEHVEYFINYIDNWAVNDSVACSLKKFKKISINEVEKFLTSNNPWSIRFALTLLLNYYINDENIDRVLELSDEINCDEYYVKMANSWLISCCYIKYKNKTEKFLEKTKIDNFTYNKAISKICDSYRVCKKDKEILKAKRRSL